MHSEGSIALSIKQVIPRQVPIVSCLPTQILVAGIMASVATQPMSTEMIHISLRSTNLSCCEQLSKQPCDVFSLQQNSSEDLGHGVGGSVMVYRLTFRPPFTWTYNCFCDCEENILYVPRIPGQQMNFTQADSYFKAQLREAVAEAFRAIGITPQGLIVTTSFWPYPAFVVNDINIAKANYIRGKYFYTLSDNTLNLRCRAVNTTTCVNMANYKTFQETATVTVDILNVLSGSQRQQLASAIQKALESQHVVFSAPIQLLEDTYNTLLKNQFYSDP